MYESSIHLVLSNCKLLLGENSERFARPMLVNFLIVLVGYRGSDIDDSLNLYIYDHVFLFEVCPCLWALSHYWVALFRLTRRGGT